jgi:hypothetical protein
MISKSILFGIFCMALCTMHAQVTPIAISTISVEKSKFSGAAIFIKEKMEEVLIEKEYVQVVDRDVTHLVDKEREIQKKEAFMDGVYVDQDKAIGAMIVMDIEYLAESKNLKISLIDVESGEKLFRKTYDIARFLTPGLEIERPDYFTRFLKEKTEEILAELDLGAKVVIELVSVSKEKKNEATEVVIYCQNACQLSRETMLKVYMEVETDPSAIFNKKRDVGEVRISFIETEQVFLAEVKSGKKEIKQLIDQGKKLFCIDEK